LVEGCLEGNQDAWNELYRRYYGLVRSVVMRKLRYCRDEWEDVTQDAWLHVMSALNTFNSDYPLPKFLCVVTERVCIDKYHADRAEKRRAETKSVDHHDSGSEGEEIPHSTLESQDEQLCKIELLKHLRGSLRTLASRCRDLIKLRFYDELPFKTIGEMLGATENTVTVQTRRCMNELRDAIRKLRGEE
jgi:RNA polymerase sigma-70 factor (ECF subfamily)